MASSEKQTIIGTSALPYYLKRIIAFLEGEKKTISFPNITQDLQDILVKIATDSIDFLINCENSNVKEESAKLAAMIKAQYNVKLTHEFCDGKLGPNVLVYKKTEANTFKMPEPLRKPNVVTSTNPAEPKSDGSVTQIFKTNCLNTTTQFVKDDSRLVLRYPEMVTSQADFVINMIWPGIQGKSEKTEVGFGFRSMFAPLWEAMRVFGLKYDFKLDYDMKPVSKPGMKRVVFEKIPKPTYNTLIKPTEVIDLDRMDSPEVIIQLDDDDDLDSDSSSSTGHDDRKAVKRKTAKKKVPKCTKKMRKYIVQLSKYIEKGLLSQEFILNSLRQIAEFLLDDNEDSIVFEKTSLIEEHFLAKVAKISTNTSTYMLFTYECQKLLDDIKYCINLRNVRLEKSYAKGVLKSPKGRLKNVKIRKVSALRPMETTDDDDGSGINSSFSSKSTTSINTSSSDPRLSSRKQPGNKLMHKNDSLVEKLLVKQWSGCITDQFIETTLERIAKFLFLDEQASIVFQLKTQDQINFIQQVSIFAKDEESYSVFTNKSREMLANINAAFKKNMLYNVRVVKKRKEVYLEKSAAFAFSDKTMGVRNPRPTNATEIIDVDVYEKCNPSQASNKTNINNNNSPKSCQQPKAVNENFQTLLIQLHEKIYTGSLTHHFMENTLRSIWKFMKDDSQYSLSLCKLSRMQLRFVESIETLALNEAYRVGFNIQIQKLLDNLYVCLKSNPYNFKRIAGTKDVVLEKVNHNPCKELEKCVENNENVSNNNQTTPLQTVPATPSDQEQLVRLKAIKDAVARSSGDQTILYFLRDISSFLTPSNKDRILKFEDVTEDECLFLKNVHVMSKLEEGYCAFPGECRDLLGSIRLKAQSYKLTFQKVHFGNGDLRTVMIEKQRLPEGDQKTGVGIEGKSRCSIRELYLAYRQTLRGNNTIVQNRARSLSEGRRAQQKGNATSEVRVRETSSQRLSVKEILKAGLAQPVHSDIALRMMESMGWKGGALGPRGDGITEPIELPLDLKKRAGLGHVPKQNKPKQEQRPKEQKQKKHKTEPEVVQPQQAVVQPTQAVVQPTQAVVQPDRGELPAGFLPLQEIPADLVPPGILSADTRKSKTIHLGIDYRLVTLKSILEMVTTDVEVMYFIYAQTSPKPFNFLRHWITVFRSRSRYDVASEGLADVVLQISEVLDQNRDITFNMKTHEETDLYPRRMVVTKKKRKTKPNTVILDDSRKTTGDIKITNIDPTNDDNTEANQKVPTAESTTVKDRSQTSRDTEPITENKWYSPITPFHPPKRIQTKNTQETKETHVPKLKTLALSIVCLQQQINFEDEIETTNTTDYEKSTDVASTTKNSKMVLRIPNTSRRLMALNNKNVVETTTYELVKEKKIIDGVNCTNIKVTKNPVEKTGKQKKDNDIKATEQKKTPGELMLEKLSVNDDPTDNRSKKSKKKPSKSVAIRLQNAVADFEDQNQNVSLNNGPKSNIVNSLALSNNTNKVASTRSKIVPVINDVAPRIDIFNTDLVAKGIGNITISEDNVGYKTSDSSKKDENNGFRMPIIPKTNITEKVLNDSVVEKNNYQINEGYIPSESNDECNHIADDDDDDCQIVFDSTEVCDNNCEVIVVDSEDEVDNTRSIDDFTDENKIINVNNDINEVNTCTKEAEESSLNSFQSDTFYDSIDTTFDTEPTPRPLLRKRPSFDYPITSPKKCKLLTDYKTLYILPEDYPQTKIDNETASQIQNAILKSIDYTQDTLPYLKCQGIQNGGLIYCCQDAKSLYFLENLLYTMDAFKIVYEFDVEEQMSYKMAFRINSYIDEPVYSVLNRLELYNSGLNATKWSVIKKEQHEDFTVIYVQIDDLSLNYVCEYNYVLYAGNDCARFTVLWD